AADARRPIAGRLGPAAPGMRPRLRAGQDGCDCRRVAPVRRRGAHGVLDRPAALAARRRAARRDAPHSGLRARL
ncbi:MAG: hypothetical protein AVDCRST_MAG85-3058, partial [uncultured Solirubrobacteraceae bacterium]